MAFEGTEKLLRRTIDFVNDHRALYIGSGGASGHIVDMSHAGAPGYTPTLLLGSTGRKSGKLQIVPLIYGVYGREWVVIASKGGAPEHPAWFLNLSAAPEAMVQVATQAFEVTWRVAEGAERESVWSYMQGVYPPYGEYQAAAGQRIIPVVLLKPVAEAAPFQADPA